MQKPSFESLGNHYFFRSIDHALCLLDQNFQPILATNLFCRFTSQTSIANLTLDESLMASVKKLSLHPSGSCLENTPKCSEIEISTPSLKSKTFLLSLIRFVDDASLSLSAGNLSHPSFIIELLPVDLLTEAAKLFDSYKAIASSLINKVYTEPLSKYQNQITNLGEVLTDIISYYDPLVPSSFTITNEIKQSLLLDCSYGRIAEFLLRIILEALDFSLAMGNLVFELGSTFGVNNDRVEIYAFVTRNPQSQLVGDSSMKLFADKICSYANRIFQNESYGANYVKHGNKLSVSAFEEHNSIAPGVFKVIGFDTNSTNLKEIEALLSNSSEAMIVQMVRSDLLVLRLSVPILRREIA